jgi:hypothetical protein
MRPLLALAVLGSGLIFAMPTSKASLGKTHDAPALLPDQPPRGKPLNRPKSIPATLKNKPGEAPAGPPIRRGKGLA